MNIYYKDERVEQQCTKFRVAKRKFPEKVAKKLLKLINLIETADNLLSITKFPKYNFHNLKGELKGFYAIDIDGRSSPYRLIVSFTEDDEEKLFKDFESITVIHIEEVSKHYG